MCHLLLETLSKSSLLSLPHFVSAICKTVWLTVLLEVDKISAFAFLLLWKFVSLYLVFMCQEKSFPLIQHGQTFLTGCLPRSTISTLFCYILVYTSRYRLSKGCKIHCGGLKKDQSSVFEKSIPWTVLSSSTKGLNVFYSDFMLVCY